MFRVAIIGADTMHDGNFCKNKCINILRAKNDAKEKIVINAIKADDSFVNRFTQGYGIDCQYFLADFNQYGQEAFNVRNNLLFENTDAFIIFDDGSNKETKFFIDIVRKKNFPCRIITK